MLMPFGKHKNQDLRSIPRDYLQWVLANCTNISYVLREEIRFVLDDAPTRPSSKSTNLSTEIIGPWYRKLAIEFHPDKRGGNHASMIAVNRARSLLLEMTGAL